MTTDDEKQEQKDKAAIRSLSIMLKNYDSRQFIKYLLQSLNVGGLPDMGLTGELLHEQLGFYRASKSIWEMVSQADHVQAGLILAEIQKEKYNELAKQNIQSNGPESSR